MSNFRNRKTVVKLNVYDLISFNDIFSSIGFGIFHSGVEINGKEWSFGGGEQFKNTSQTGVFSQRPRQIPDGMDIEFRESFDLFETNKTSREIRRCLEEMQSDPRWQARNYHVLEHNCNHFTDQLIRELSDEQCSAPSWLNRPAKTGSWFLNCLPCLKNCFDEKENENQTQQQQQQQQRNQVIDLENSTSTMQQMKTPQTQSPKKSPLFFQGKGNKIGKRVD
ncbi:hypothetical protein M0813_01982 [Anaeramoeba flamelloides]|uniref:PPPDE domain-containing protein n=1 Tax=Anaeramoeba flamelloides TaxID=1746091 RepID=A0ABQ8YQC4_9EUKA|nr:hypothetical protein M0813_01982 [Anaeramoeba flamelloides]